MIDTRKMFQDSARMIADVASNPPPITSGMASWLDYCDNVAPECRVLWQQLRALDFDNDANDLTMWLTRLFGEEPPPKEINGLWFGLYNPVFDDGEASCQMYIGGSAAFDPNSDSNEWACQLSYFPVRRYSTSPVLTALYRPVEAITANNVYYLGEPFLCHGYLALVVSHWCNGPVRKVLLR